MEQRRASRTAFATAVRRAQHQLLDRPLVFEDPLSLRIVGPESEGGRYAEVSRRQQLTPSFRAFMAARSRYAEDKMAEAYAAGVRQCVILGAGLDTFGYRNPHPGLKVFEVDHPGTQQWKRELLAAASIVIPPDTLHVAADFEHHTLSEALAPSGFDFHQPAFFSWLGVTMYLTEPAFNQTIDFIASLPAPTAVVFDYSVPRESLNLVQRMAFDALAGRVAQLGEPFTLFFDPATLTASLKDAGFTRIEDLGHQELNRHYFSNRTDDLKVKGRLGRLLFAGK